MDSIDMQWKTVYREKYIVLFGHKIIYSRKVFKI